MATDFTESSPEVPAEDRVEEAARPSPTPTSIPIEADSADVLAQNMEVPLDDDDRDER
ncbi:hypothetical protein QMK17_21980 [Rhodococcus sp. G-MC3]|uniref:hypothetical protein n=1 Tax=Rhodococcus sp. G-MC3 TaxID=3046209 RepID=UPI0024BB15B4|nr:hypothetical protein [Rhodococcus sp. G-MC3]MDJ0395994.1 hypothetical protein [Rhodococcus sp. G-MC3]